MSGAGSPQAGSEEPPTAPPEVLDAAVRAIEAGQIIGLPTDTVYGIGADPWRADAVERIFEAKGRPEAVALPVLVGDPADAATLAVLDDRARRLIDRYWPGPLTIVLRRWEATADTSGTTPTADAADTSGTGAAPPRRLHLGGDDKTVGIRCPDHPTARALLVRTGPLAVTSANRHGGEPAHSVAELRASLGEAVGVVVDGGPLEGAPSTVVSLVEGDWRCLREGAITTDELAALLD